MKDKLFYISLFFGLTVAQSIFAVDVLSTFRTTAETQASTNIFPFVVFIVLAGAGIYSVIERSIAPFAWALAGCFVVALSPNAGPALITQFSSITF